MNKLILLYPLLYVLYFYVGFSSPGFDDEFYNISNIEKLGIGVIKAVQTSDVHPPGSYFIDWLLFRIFGRWDAVRGVISILSATSILYAVEAVRRKFGNPSGLLCFLLLGLNPAILLWCTSIRWYAFFVPITIWILIIPAVSGVKYWLKCFGGLLLLAYFGYAFVIVAPSIFLLYWISDNDSIKVKLKNILLCGSLFFGLYSYQFVIFFTIHLKNKTDQISTIARSLLGFWISLIGNQGLFPISFFGVITSIGIIGASIIGCSFSMKRPFFNSKNKYMMAYGMGSLLSIITGLSGKFRNLVVISPFQSIWLSTIKINNIYLSKLYRLFIFMIIIGNLAGDFNVISHKNTTKNSWNIPVITIIKYLDNEKTKCGGDLVVLSHDPTLSIVLEKNYFQSISPYSILSTPNDILIKQHACVIILETYSGAISEKKYNSMQHELSKLEYKNIDRTNFGKDNYFYYKRKLDSRYPEYIVSAYKYYDVVSLSPLVSWYKP